MTVVLVVGTALLFVICALAALVIIAVAVERRRQRRLALQRVLVVQAANQRLRAVSQAAVSDLFDEALRLRRGAR